LDKLATEILHFENGAATYHVGTYSDFYNEHHRKQQVDASTAAGRKKAASKPVKSERSSAVRVKRARPLAEIEEEIHLLEKELTELSEKLAAPAPDWGPQDYTDIGSRQASISSRLQQLYEEWEGGQE
jgi:ATP-binding cassette, subfamily F, member 3